MRAKLIYASLTPLGFFRMKNMCLGSYKGYGVMLYRSNCHYFVKISASVDRKNKLLLKSIARKAKELCRRVIFNQCSGDFIIFLIRFNRRSPYADQFRAYMDAIVNTLEQNGVSPPATCGICGRSRPESFCFFNMGYRPVHRSCIIRALDQAWQQIEQNKANGSYLTGLLGALLGMLLGALPAALVLVFFDYMSFLLFALVPLAASLAYTKFNGRTDLLSILINISVSIAGVFVIQYLYSVVSLLEQYNITLGDALDLALQLLFVGEGLSYFIRSNGYLFSVMFCGILISWGSIRATNSFFLKNMETLESSLRPNPVYTLNAASDNGADAAGTEG